MEQTLMFAPLETPQRRWKPFLIAAGIEIKLIALALVLNALFPHQLEQAKKYVYTSLVAPVEPTIREAQPVNPRLQVRLKPVPVLETPTVAKLVVPTQVRKIREPQPDIKAPEINLAFSVPNLPKLPNAPQAQVVATNTFAAPTNVTPTTAKPAAQVQAGGFGDPNGIPATGDGKRGVNIAAKGNSGLPMGAGFGNGIGGAKGTPGVGIVGNGTVQSSGFDKQATVSVQRVEVVASGTASAVEILSKPRPTYTEEGRRRGVEGEVKLEVKFTAGGQARVVKVLQGLGYGLDEMAFQCAEQIKFKPAMHAGQPVDSTAVVHIIFQLAS
jgi:TonB family protein